MPSFVSGMTSCWKSLRSLFGCTQKKRASKRKVTVVESNPIKSETTAQPCLKIFEITENDELWTVVSNPRNRKEVVDQSPAILETIADESDPHLPSSDVPEELSQLMLAKGFAMFDHLYSLREEIKQLKAKNGKLITKLNMAKHENYRLVLLRGVHEQGLKKQNEIFNKCGTMVSESLELLQMTASQNIDENDEIDGTISHVRPSSRDGCEVVVQQMPTVSENGNRPRVSEVEAENSRQKAALAVYENRFKRLFELNVEMKKEFSSLSSETFLQLMLPCLETNLDDPQKTRCLFTAV